MQKVLVAFDFSPPARRALEHAKLLHAKLKSAIDVVYVDFDPFEGVPKMPQESLWATKDQIEARRAGAASQLTEAVAEIFGPEAQAVKTHVLHGQPHTALVEFAKQHGHDLICIGTTGKGKIERVLLGSVAERVLRTSPVAVLTVH